MFGTYSQREVKKIKPLADKVIALEEEYREKSDQELKNMTPQLRERLQKGETLDDILPEAFATCREAADRVLGLRHFPVQILGGIILHQGRISEMRTGEGKTLAATLPAYLNALSGKGVHIVTVNDYLAKRDSEWMGKIYRFLGMSVGLVIHAVEPDTRKAMYDCDITYGTNNEFGFDYLRDNMQIYKERMVQREFNYAIVDEVDSILIDEARTPLIISGRGDKSTDLYKVADRFARTLKYIRVKEVDTKEDNDDVDADYIVDEKAKTATLTRSGVKKAESYFNIENLMDPSNTTLQHHINQAIRAHGIMQRDIDYVVKDGEIIIVDEFTGRLMIGRRYNEGLHQAIEAKEGVEVNRESKTLATITFQNYFRMYQKLSGMTGTALTEDAEFREIYGLDVVEIPTNKPVRRVDHTDVVYKTEKAKFNAVIDQIAECHKKGQPVLVGTISIEKSERLSKMLGARGIRHEVLNAKYHEKEAQIVSQAGKFGAVTIATNMAGRGTDIKLGGNEENMAVEDLRRAGFENEAIVEATGFADTEDENIIAARALYQQKLAEHKKEVQEEAAKVKEAGGLFIIGTERHESRRIDNQLRGRSGRQGDPGETRFYLSLEDELLRLFGGERTANMMDFLKIEEDMPIEAKMLSNTIESAQQKVEGRNFATRKSVLQFDDVMNKQREIIYSQRRQVLDGEDMKDVILKMVDETIENAVSLYLPEEVAHDSWDFNGLRNHFLGWITLPQDFEEYKEVQKLGEAEAPQIAKMLVERAHTIYEKREEMFTPRIMRELERVILLKNVDMHWMDHIDNMEELKRGIYLRSYAQKDPVVEYRIEGFEMFDAMIASIRENTVRALFLVQIKKEEEPPKREAVADEKELQAVGGSDTGAVDTTVHKKKVGRNDLCPCGSGKKYKKCCGR
ncbi:MAG: preprotein translocase subunit SecA [Provencibacterium sp.]|nr:preprotein translocase subunit SecA [Provencibacterium sp.]